MTENKPLSWASLRMQLCAHAHSCIYDDVASDGFYTHPHRVSAGSGCEIYDCPPVTGPDCHGLEDAVCGLLENSTRTAPVCVDCPYPFMGYSCEFRCFHGTAVPPPSDVSNVALTFLILRMNCSVVVALTSYTRSIAGVYIIQCMALLLGKQFKIYGVVYFKFSLHFL